MAHKRTSHGLSKKATKKLLEWAESDGIQTKDIVEVLEELYLVRGYSWATIREKTGITMAAISNAFEAANLLGLRRLVSVQNIVSTIPTVTLVTNSLRKLEEIYDVSRQSLHRERKKRGVIKDIWRPRLSEDRGIKDVEGPTSPRQYPLFDLDGGGEE